MQKMWTQFLFCLKWKTFKMRKMSAPTTNPREGVIQMLNESMMRTLSKARCAIQIYQCRYGNVDKGGGKKHDGQSKFINLKQDVTLGQPFTSLSGRKCLDIARKKNNPRPIAEWNVQRIELELQGRCVLVVQKRVIQKNLPPIFLHVT